MATLGEQTVGSKVKLNVNGSAKNFIVAHHGLPSSVYDSSCDGTWLFMDDVYESRAFDSSDNDYENSDIHSYLNNTFLNLFDSEVKNIIKQVRLPYRKGAGTSTTVTSGAGGLSARVFLLSYAEIGRGNHANAPAEGASLSYFNGNSNLIGYLNGAACPWFVRTPNTSGATRVWRVSMSGAMERTKVTYAFGVRPAIVLPYESAVNDNGLVDGAISSGGISGQVPINGVMCDLTGEGYININGVLCPISDSGVNIGGIINSTKG